MCSKALAFMELASPYFLFHRKSLLIFMVFYALVFNTPTIAGENVEQEIEGHYPALTPYGIPEKAVKSAIIAFKTLQVQGGISNSSLISFVNFSIPSNKDRMFIYDLGSKRVVFQSNVAHGKNSGAVASPASRFSNVDNSNQSSIGFYVTANRYSGKHGTSLRLKGISQGLNTSAMDRAIVIHAANYVSSGGRSLGCLALPPSNNNSIISLVENGSLIYAFTEQNLPEFGSTQIASQAPITNQSSVPDVSDVKPELKEFESVTSLSSASDPVSISGSSQILAGSSGYKDCQSLSNKSWEETVEGIRGGKDPGSFFTGSWKVLQNKIVTEEIENEDASKLANDNLNQINNCVAMAYISTKTDFKKENIDTFESKSSSDGKIKCVYTNSQSQDYNLCLKSILAYEALTENERAIYKKQESEYSEAVKKGLSKIDLDNAQNSTLKELSKAQVNVQDISLERAQIASDKLNILQAIANQIPTAGSLKSDCDSSFKKHGTVSVSEYNYFVQTVSVKELTPKLTDFCQNVVSSELNLIQNNSARQEIKSVLSGYGKEIAEHEFRASQAVSFSLSLNRESAINFNLEGNSPANFGYDTNNEIDEKYIQFENNTFKTNKDGIANNSSVNLDFFRSNSETGHSLNAKKTTQQDEQGIFYNRSIEYSDERRGTGLAGVYNDEFYSKIKIALSNPEKLNELKMSKDQLKEYYSQKLYFDSLKPAIHSGTQRSIASKIDNTTHNQINSKELNLFQIISRKYVEVFND